MDVNITNNILEYIINNYTSEAGIRGIKSKLEDIFMKLNLDKLNDKIKKNKLTLNKKIVHEILKEPKLSENKINDKPAIGVINGLYATAAGGGGITVIQIYKNIEQSCNNYEIKITGKQGDVMKESVYCSLTAAIDYLKRHHTKYNIDRY